MGLSWIIRVRLKCYGKHHDKRDTKGENSLVVQWLGLRAFTDEGLGSIPGLGTKIPQAAWPKKRKEKKRKERETDRGRLHTQKRRREHDQGGRHGEMQPQAKECRQPPEAGRGEEQILP